MDLLTGFDALVRAETRLWNRLDRELAAGGHPRPGSLTVLRVVGTRPDCRVNDIAQTLDITHGGTSKIVDRLVAAGHVRRDPHPTDGRASVLTLTRRGRTALRAAESAATAWLATEAPALADLGPRLTDLLRSTP